MHDAMQLVIAAPVGADHLVPRDVTLSLFDRFDVATVCGSRHQCQY